VLDLYLKKLEIQGFKSFADKISLDFSSGITSVVGPNGSGKSNIADAIRWVLGEQSARTLRGSKMEDVIFAGTEQRKPLGFSEVSLTIDNSDGLLPVEYSEVTITRRVFRSGESEYFINKTSCRLKDINELFFDTGLGKDGYSVIGQGRVDEILSNKSEDRRRIFEEASGIMKYRVRRQESEKKLESTKQNLLRIKDVIGELENQLEPLRLASETARKYLNLRENLKEQEVSVFVDTITKHKEVVLDLENQLSLIKENINFTNYTLEKYSIENRQRSELIKSMDEKLDSTRQEFYSLESKLERCLSDIKLNEEKTQNLLINIERIDKEMDQINLKLDGISREIRLKEDKLKTLNSNYNEYRLQLTEHEKKMEAQLSLLSESERNIEKLKVEMMYKIDNVSNKKLQINSLRSFLGNIIENYQSLESEIQQLILDNGEEKSKSNKLAESIAKSNKNLETYYSIRMLLNSTKDQLESKLSKYRNTQNSLKSETQVKSSRYKMLNEMENNFEGYHKSVRSILKACRQSSEFGQGIHGALVQLIEVEKKYEIAIEMVLGSALQYIITTNEEDAKKAIQQLKITRMGRATFLPIASVNGQYIGSKIVSQLKKCKGFCGIASDLLSYDKEYNGIILSLLGRVVVVDNIDTGISIARDFRNTFKLVTLEGDIISTTGSMTGGSVADRGVGILSRSREINELKTEIQSLQKKYQSVEKEIIVLIEKINTNEKEISSIEEEVKNCQLVIVRDDSHLSQVKENISKNSSRIDAAQVAKHPLNAKQRAYSARCPHQNHLLLFFLSSYP
jgi:chromosome segregation protein